MANQCAQQTLRVIQITTTCSNNGFGTRITWRCRRPGSGPKTELDLRIVIERHVPGPDGTVHGISIRRDGDDQETPSVFARARRTCEMNSDSALRQPNQCRSRHWVNHAHVTRSTRPRRYRHVPWPT